MTAMDALTHAVEAFIGPQKNPVSDAFAVSAIEMIRDNIRSAVTDGKDKTVRLVMANAALLAGLAFSNSMVGVVHALAHAVGGVCHVPHGIANSIILPFGLEFYMDKSPKVKSHIEKLLLALAGPEEFVKTPADRQAQASVASIRAITRDLKDLCGLPISLRDTGVPEDKLGDIAQVAVNDGAIAFSPVEVSVEEALGVLKAAY